MHQSEPSEAKNVTWVVTSQTAPWVVRRGLAAEAIAAIPDVIVRTDIPRQSIEGFGACFNELGWTSLAALNLEERDAIFRELFAPGIGANFNLCRMPIGANDIARTWYSYDETPDDFTLEHFSIANDLETLVPFIKSALKHQPELKLWASPWSPPTWMKSNKHYAAAMPAPWQQGATNGLRPDQVGKEGTDMFLQEERYFRAYASYFGRFVEVILPRFRVEPENIGIPKNIHLFDLPITFEQHVQHVAPPHTKLHNHVQLVAMAPYFAQHGAAQQAIQKEVSSIADCLALDTVAEENVHQVGP